VPGNADLQHRVLDSATQLLHGARPGESADRTVGRRLSVAATSVLLVLLLGTAGYVIIEDAGWFDALYMTIVTVTTVGYSELIPLGTGGRVLNIFIILFGVATILYVAGALAEYLLSGQLGGVIGHRRMKRQIAGMSGHYVVCGYGRTGENVVTELIHAGKQVVVVDSSELEVERAIANGHAAVLGDSGSDDTLRDAGVERATGFVAAIVPDASVLMAVLSARTLNPELNIVARAEQRESESKLKSAGADRVISIHRIAGHRLANMVVRPEVAEFLEVVLTDHEVEVEMDMVRLAQESPFDAMTLGESGIIERTSANIVGVRKRGGTMPVLATPGTVLNSTDVLVAIGTRPQLDGLKEVASVDAG
jgi:voltage-gated potassium channel